MTFNPVVRKTELIDAINRLEPGILGHRAAPSSLELRAEYIKQLCKLVADHVEECADDADASTHSRINARDARIIVDVGGDIAGQIMEAVEREVA
jgi:hypothetical protein